MTLSDARGREIELRQAPRRIVSLVPSATETLFSLGVGKRVVGRTHFCIRPGGEIGRVMVIGGTKRLNVDVIEELRPDLILANMEENRREDIDRLELVAPVFVLFPRSVGHAIEGIRTLGTLTATEERARELAMQIGSRLGALRAAAARHGRYRFAYLIWRHPYMTVNEDTFIAALLAEGGGRNVFGRHRERYPRISLEEMVEADPAVVFLPSEPYSFLEKHRLELATRIGNPERWLPRLVRVPGDLFCWHGVRLLEGLPYYRQLLARLDQA